MQENKLAALILVGLFTSFGANACIGGKDTDCMPYNSQNTEPIYVSPQTPTDNPKYEAVLKYGTPAIEKPVLMKPAVGLKYGISALPEKNNKIKK